MIANISVLNQVATVELDSPNPMNTLTPGAFGELRDIFSALRDDDDVRAVILTGKGRAFCAGAALDGFLENGQMKMTPEYLRRSFDENVNPLLRIMMDLPKPIIIAVNGAVAGAGMGLALAGDIVIASEEAKFHCGFVKMLGIVPDVGSCWLLPNLMGRNKALPFALLGDSLTARQASDAGMIFHTVPADVLMVEAGKYADRLKTAPVDALRRTRKLFTDAPSTNYSDMLDRERDANVELVAGPDLEEGVKAFLEKRAPDFAGATQRRRQKGI